MYTGTGPQQGFFQSSYVITVDAAGCLIPGCAVDLTESEPTEPGLLAYPNPTTNVLNIELPSKDNWSLQLYNTAGQPVWKTRLIQANNTRCNLENLPLGLYVLTATNGQGPPLQKKVMVR